MRRFAFSGLPASLRKLVMQQDPLEEDIGLYEKKRLVAVLIQPEFYRFALKMAEKVEDEIARETVRKYSMRKKR